MEAGRPVLVVPPRIEHRKGARVVVAWKDRPAARRAVSAVLPFICNAAHVYVATAGENARHEGTEDVTRHHSRHGASVTTHFLRTVDGDADEILRFARQQEAGRVVMGALGHTRLREWMFGGARVRSTVAPFDAGVAGRVAALARGRAIRSVVDAISRGGGIGHANCCADRIDAGPTRDASVAPDALTTPTITNTRPLILDGNVAITGGITSPDTRPGGRQATAVHTDVAGAEACGCRRTAPHPPRNEKAPASRPGLSI